MRTWNAYHGSNLKFAHHLNLAWLKIVDLILSMKEYAMFKSINESLDAEGNLKWDKTLKGRKDA